jgi:hypothetical protein
MLARFFKAVSNNPLIAAIVGTVIGGWILAQLLAMKAPDVGGVLGAVGRWLRAPAGSTRVDEITLALLAIVLGFLSCTALFLHEAHKQQRRRAAPGAPPAAAPAPDVAVIDAGPKPEPPKREGPAVTPAPDVVDPDSMEGYFSGVRALRERFAEREEYLRKCRGRAVRWSGTVRNVRGVGSDNSVAVHLLGTSGQLTLTSVIFPGAFRERVLALRPGDSVLVTGRLRECDEDIVQIDGDGFELVKR